MKTKMIAVLCLCFSTICFSQDNGFLEFNGSLDYGYRFYIIEDDGAILQPDFDEIPKFGYRAGLAYNFEFKENVWLKTGVRYLVGGYKSRERYSGFFPVKTSYKYDYGYLEVPFAVRLEKPVKSWKSFWEFGLSPAFYVQTTYTSYVNDEKSVSNRKEDKDRVNRFAVGGYVSHGILYQIHEIVQVYGALALRMNFSPTHNSNRFKEYLFNAGFEMGVQLGL